MTHTANWFFHDHDVGGVSEANKCHFVYVHNLGVVSLDAATTSEVLGEGSTSFDRVGPKTHEHVLDGTAKETRVTPRRWWRLSGP